MKSLLLLPLLASLALLPTLTLAGERFPPRPAGRYGKNVPDEPVDEPLKYPKDPSLWWKGITDDDVFYPEFAAIDARAEMADATAHKKKKKNKEKPKGLQFAGKWKYCGCTEWTNEDKCGKRKHQGGGKERWSKRKCPVKAEAESGSIPANPQDCKGWTCLFKGTG